MQISEKTVLLVAEIEAHVVGQAGPLRDANVQWLSTVKRLLWFPIPFLLKGIFEKLKSLGIFAFILTLFLFLVFSIAFSNSPPELNAINMNVVFGLAVIVSGSLVACSMPTSYGDSGVKPENVAFVREFLKTLDVKTEKEIELLKKSVKIFEDRTRARVTALKWIVSLVWAGFTYTFIKGIESSMSGPPQPPQIVVTAQLLILLIALYFIVWGYEAAVDKLFRTIEFGCNDFCQDVGMPKEKGS